jgi:hypothetical protein
MVKNGLTGVAVDSHQKWGGYNSPEVKVITFQPEGVLCSSGLTEKFNEETFSDGSFWN